MLIGLSIPQNGSQQAGKTPVDRGAPQLIDVSCAVIPGLDQSGIPQYAEMMRHARFWAVAIERVTTRLAIAIKLAHNAEAHWIAQRIEHALQFDIANVRMLQCPHGRSFWWVFLSDECSIIIVQ